MSECQTNLYLSDSGLTQMDPWSEHVAYAAVYAYVHACTHGVVNHCRCNTRDGQYERDPGIEVVIVVCCWCSFHLFLTWSRSQRRAWHGGSH